MGRKRKGYDECSNGPIKTKIKKRSCKFKGWHCEEWPFIQKSSQGLKERNASTVVFANQRISFCACQWGQTWYRTLLSCQLFHKNFIEAKVCDSFQHNWISFCLLFELFAILLIDEIYFILNCFTLFMSCSEYVFTDHVFHLFTRSHWNSMQYLFVSCFE